VASTSIPALDLPIQFFAPGTAVGMLASLAQYRRTGEVDHWPVYVACCALGLFFIGFVVVVIDALR
jgi:hypothetical protein